MDKFTLFELHVHDGMELSAKNTAPAIGRSLFSRVKGDSDAEDVDEEYEELEEVVDDDDDTDDADADEDDATSRAPGPLGLLVGLVVLAVLAIAIRKLRGGDTDLEIAELDDLSEMVDEEEAEH